MIMLCYIHQAQQTNTCPRPAVETQEEGVKHNENCQKRLQENVIDIVLFSSFLTLSI